MLFLKDFDPSDAKIFSVRALRARAGAYGARPTGAGVRALLDSFSRLGTSAGLPVCQTKSTAVDGLHHRHECLCDILRTMATLPCSHKCTAASCLPCQLAVQSGRTLQIPSRCVQPLQNATDRRGIVAGGEGEVASKCGVSGDGCKASALKSGRKDGSNVGHGGRHGRLPAGPPPEKKHPPR
jgi:hypothetical protein